MLDNSRMVTPSDAKLVALSALWRARKKAGSYSTVQSAIDDEIDLLLAGDFAVLQSVSNASVGAASSDEN